MKPELLAAAFMLQRLHGAAFAAAFLEEYGLSNVDAIRLLADRPESNQHLDKFLIKPTRTD